VVEHLSFMAAAVIGWWPVLGSDQLGKTKLSAPGKAFYLFLSTFPCTALAALITFSSHQLYTFYGSAPLQVGLTPLLDQQLGGVLMWLPGDMIFMLAILIIIGGWLFQPTQVKDLPKVEAKQEPRSAASFRRSTLKEAADRGL
jgi:cytochrome c oxidase assembly factor CtaG